MYHSEDSEVGEVWQSVILVTETTVQGEGKGKGKVKFLLSTPWKYKGTGLSRAS
jgi:hypothetical protein